MMIKAKALQTCQGQQSGVKASVTDGFEAGFDIAAQQLGFQVGSEAFQQAWRRKLAEPMWAP